METRAIIQVIGMEAVVLTFLFAMVFVAVRISVAERRANHRQEESLIPASGDRPRF